MVREAHFRELCHNWFGVFYVSAYNMPESRRLIVKPDRIIKPSFAIIPTERNKIPKDSTHGRNGIKPIVIINTLKIRLITPIILMLGGFNSNVSLRLVCLSIKSATGLIFFMPLLIRLD